MIQEERGVLPAESGHSQSKHKLLGAVPTLHWHLDNGVQPHGISLFGVMSKAYLSVREAMMIQHARPCLTEIQLATEV